MGILASGGQIAAKMRKTAGPRCVLESSVCSLGRPMPVEKKEYPEKAKRLLSLLKPEQSELISTRRALCEPCSQNQRLHQITVICKAGGCAEISLIHGRCKLRRWPTPGSDSTGKPIVMPVPPEEPEWMSRLAVTRADHKTARNTAPPGIGATFGGVRVGSLPGAEAVEVCRSSCAGCSSCMQLDTHYVRCAIGGGKKVRFVHGRCRLRKWPVIKSEVGFPDIGLVVVLGTGRSGTSMITGLITALGFDPGEDLIPASRSNLKGVFEDRPFFNLVNDPNQNRQIIETFLASISHPMRVVKAPPLANHLPLTFPVGTRFVWAHRPMADVLDSAARAYGGRAESYRDFLEPRYIRIVSFLMSRDHLRIEYDQARSDPQGTAQRVAAWLGVPMSEQAQRFIEPPGSIVVSPIAAP